MSKSIILDFIGVIADIDYKKLILDMPIKQKISALRIFLNFRKNRNIKHALNYYQKGLITIDELQDFVGGYCPNSAYVIKLILNKLPKYVKVNEDIVNLASSLNHYGIRMFIISNSIPETEQIINNLHLQDIFDGIVLSTQLGFKKPMPDIYDYLLKTYGVNPKETLMIDDNIKNLDMAQKFGIATKKCKTSKETYDILLDYLYQFDKTQHNQNI